MKEVNVELFCMKQIMNEAGVRKCAITNALRTC